MKRNIKTSITGTGTMENFSRRRNAGPKKYKVSENDAHVYTELRGLGL